jgi:hypothetical protein
MGEALLSRVLGGVATWLPILSFFPIAMVAAGRLARRSTLSRLSAGLLYAVNPFVFDRLYVGHIALLIGYALLPFAVASAIESPQRPVSRWAAPMLWWAALTALSPHFAWIYGLVLFGVVCVGFATRPWLLRRLLMWFSAVAAGFALMSTYIFLPYSSTQLSTQVGTTSLAIYRTSGDPHLGLFGNVLGLYGFWRIGPRLPKEVISGWPFLLLAVLLVAALGAWTALRKHPNESGESPSDDRRPLALLLIFVGVAGYFLALGSQGPTGGIFHWAYDHVPFFDIMREPQKFLMLLALAYAVLFGWGTENLSRIDISPRKAGAVATALIVGIALPLGYTATIFDGLDGQIAPSVLPASYQQANALMGEGPGNILYLPWHLYMEYPFTDGRVVSNVAPTSFSRNVISGDNVEAYQVETQSTSPRSAYLQKLYSAGDALTSFGGLVAPLGVEYVVLAKTVDFASYGWLSHQSDLRLVFNSSSLEVWRNSAYVGVGHRVSKLTSVRNLSGVEALAAFGQLGSGAVITTSVSGPAQVGQEGQSVRQISPVAYEVPPGRPGWVEIDTAYQPGWSLDGRPAIQSAEGTVLLPAGARGGLAQFTPWGLLKLGYILSGGTFLLLLIVSVWSRRRKQPAH